MYTPGLHSTPWIRLWPWATEIIERVWHILDTRHHQFCSFLLKGRVKKGGMAQCPPLNTLLHTRKQCIDA